MKKFIRLVCLMIALCLLCACGHEAAPVEEKQLVKVGFSQLGSESDWRAANTKSMTDAFSEGNGYELLYENAKQRQENQLLAIRNFVLQNVDIIVLAPVAETGWDNALAEAKNAGIPVIIVDREVAVDDDSLYLCGIGSDFLQEGRTAVNWLQNELLRQHRAEDEIRIFNLKGTAGATAEINRTKAIEEGAQAHENWNIAAEYYGEFTEAKGYEVVRDYLKTDQRFEVLYSQNDNMTFGAIRALEEAGISYGVNGEVIIISFDAVRDALQMCLDGKINLCVECSPLHGPRVDELIKLYQEGKPVRKKIYVQETSFTKANLTQEIIDQRPY